MHDAWLGKLFVRFRERRDGKALAAVFDATARELIAVAAHLAPTLDQAEDVVQTTFLRALEHAERYDPGQSLKGWLYGILWREAAKLRRSQGRPIEPEAVRAFVPLEPLDDAARRELEESVRDALARVPSPYREVLEPVLREERSSREVAAALARSPGTVRVQLQRGLERLRRELAGVRQRAPAGARWEPREMLGLAAMRARVLDRAGFARASVPAASSAFLAWQLASVAVSPAVLGCALLLGSAAAVTLARTQTDPSRLARASAPVHEPSATPAALRSGAELEAARPPAQAAAREAQPPEPAYALPPQVEGIVRAFTGEPLTHREVVAEGENHYGYRATTTDEHGRFAFAELAAGKWYFHSDDERYARADWRTYGAELADDGPPQELELVLQPADALSGRVFSAGQPVEPSEVACRRVRSTTPFRATAELEPGGRYRLERLAPGDYELRVAAADALTQAFEVRVDAADTRFDLELAEGRIEGRLVDVELAPPRSELERRCVRVFPYGWYPESGNRGAYVQPDASGRFVVRHLVPGDYVVTLAGALEPVAARVVTITAAAPVQTLELSPARALGELAGRVRGRVAGRLSVAAFVREAQGLRRIGYTEVDPDGAFRQALEPGRYALLVSDFDARMPFTWFPEATVATDETCTVELALPPARTVRIQLDPGEAWSARSLWRLRLPSGDWLSYLFFVGSDADGQRAPARPFQLPLGEYALEADFGDPAPVVHPFTVEPGEGSLELVIERTR